MTRGARISSAVVAVVAVLVVIVAACSSAPAPAAPPNPDDPPGYVELPGLDGVPTRSWCIAPGLRLITAGTGRPAERWASALDVYGWQNGPDPKRVRLGCPS